MLPQERIRRQIGRDRTDTKKFYDRTRGQHRAVRQAQAAGDENAEPPGVARTPAQESAGEDFTRAPARRGEQQRPSGARGQDAPVTIVEFTYFQCPFCKKTEDTLKQLRRNPATRFASNTWTSRCRSIHTRLTPRRRAMCRRAGQVLAIPRCAVRRSEQADARRSEGDSQDARLNTGQFDACFDKAKYDSQVKSDEAAGEKLGVDGTPAFFIDGRPLMGAQPLRSSRRSSTPSWLPAAPTSKRRHISAWRARRDSAGFFLPSLG